VDGRVVELAHTGDACSISQASVSMMSEAITGRTLDEALDVVEHFRLVMHGSESGEERSATRSRSRGSPSTRCA